MATATAKGTGVFRVLMFDTEGVFFDWETQVNRTGRCWDVLRVEDLDTMLHYLDRTAYHVVAVVSSLHMHRDHDCLIKARSLQPVAVRIQLPGMPQSGPQMDKSMALAHRVFARQTTVESIVETTEYLVKINRLARKKETGEYLSARGPLPSPPAIYEQLNRTLSSDSSSADQIGGIIGQDPALAATILRLANSAFYGRRKKISNIRDAVSLLGVRHLRALALSGHLTRLYPQTRQWRAFSFEALNRRSVLVARLAHQLCVERNTDKNVQEQAFLAGLLHDLGHLIIASTDPVRYREVVEYAADNEISISSAEKKLLGFFHGEVAAYMLSQWDLPTAVVEAVLLHHSPNLAVDSGFTPLAAVHIADALVPAPDNQVGANMQNRLSGCYIRRTGLDRGIFRFRELAEEYLRASLVVH